MLSRGDKKQDSSQNLKLSEDFVAFAKTKAAVVRTPSSEAVTTKKSKRELEKDIQSLRQENKELRDENAELIKKLLYIEQTYNIPINLDFLKRSQSENTEDNNNNNNNSSESTNNDSSSERIQRSATRNEKRKSLTNFKQKFKKDEKEDTPDKICEAELQIASLKSQFESLIVILEGEEKKKERLRMKALQELLLTEAEYIRDLEVIVNIFLIPMRDYFLKPNEVAAIFSNLELILGINTLLMQDLNQKVDKMHTQNSADCTFAEVFLDIGNFLKMYVQYVSNHEKSLETFENCKKSSQFASFLKTAEARNECRGLNLISFLVKPIQRVCKYPLLLKELLHHTDNYHPDYNNLQRAIEQLETVTTSINESKRNEENQRKTMDIVKKLVGIDAEEIVIPTRRFIQEADFIKISKGRPQERHFFLFNDLIVYAKLISKRKETYQFKDKLNLTTTICGGVPNTDKIQFAFELTRVDEKKIKKYIICTDSEETKDSWMKNIMKYHKEAVAFSQKLNQKKTPGTPSTPRGE